MSYFRQNFQSLSKIVEWLNISVLSVLGIKIKKEKGKVKGSMMGKERKRNQITGVFFMY